MHGKFRSFSSSVIPLSSEQMRAFAEKGVSQPDSYAKFKDVAESHNAPSRPCSPPARRQRLLRQADGNHEVNTTATLDFAQELLGVKTPRSDGAVDLHAKKQFETITPGQELAELTQKVAAETVERSRPTLEAVKPAA